MEKVLNILAVTLIAAAVLQIAGVNFLTRGYSSIQLMQSADWSAFTAVSSMLPLLF
jgi:hypothetical protein